MTGKFDLLVVGGGVMGLWAARYAAAAGLRVALVDKGRIGGGGSNGLLGALLPHLPNAANDKKSFQWQALAELPHLLAGLEAETGLSTGYRQCGRLMPIRLEGYRKRLQRCVDEAPNYWQLSGGPYAFGITETAPQPGWDWGDLAPLGFAFDNLSARANPRKVTAALRATLENKTAIIEGFDFLRFDEVTGRAVARDGREIAAGQVVLAAGYETYPMLRPLLGGEFGGGVKGHSALFRLEGLDDSPILYDDSVYVVPHDDGLVAVGSTSLDAWDDPDSVSLADCAPFIDKAKRLCPLLEGAEPVSLWAGVRPRSHAKEPMVGQLKESGKIHVLTGGYKISFGIAHRLARALIERLTDASDPLPLPASYEVAYHLAEARRDGRLLPGPCR